MRVTPWMWAGAGIVIVLATGSAIGSVVIDGHSFLTDSLRPAVLDRAVWCWEDAATKAQVSASESRRDQMVVRTAILGADRSFPNYARPGSIHDRFAVVRRIDRESYRLGYIYAIFWSPADRRRLFDHIAASRPICSASFGPFTRSAG